MSKRDLFGDEVNANNSGDFASMFADSIEKAGRRLSVGDSFTGEILSINKEEAFISTSTPVDAVILIADLLDENKVLKHSVGDKIDVVVVKTKGNEIRVSVAGSKKSNSDLDSLEDAYDMELPVEGRVTELCNGGFRVSVQGKQAFCPISQMDYKIVDQQEYVNKKFDFIITQLDLKKRNIVVSRRRLLDQQKVEQESVFLQKDNVGETLSGQVSRIEKFGAFVKLENGLEGLVHISEISWSRIENPEDVLSIGQNVVVKVLKTDDINGKLKISLSIKQAGGEGDPWSLVMEKFPLKTVHNGIVEKKESYGLFVNLGPGITGLLPKSKWRDSLDHQHYETRKKGDSLKVQIDEILFEQKKISLGVPIEHEDVSWKQSAIEGGFKNSSFGSLASLINNKK